MKYRFSKSNRAHPKPAQGRRYRLIGRKTVRAVQPPAIRMGDLFSQPLLPAKGKAGRRGRFGLAIRKGWGRFSLCFKSMIRRVATPKTLSLLCGALCASLLMAVCFGTAMLAILFGPYRQSGDPVTVPDFRNQSMDTVLREKEAHLALSVTYEYNQGYPAGTVISQTPSPGVTRHLRRGEKNLTVKLTVAREDASYTLPSLSGMSRRDACLLLRNEGLRVRTVKESTSAEKADQVLRSEPSVGTSLALGSTVTLYVGKAKEIPTVRVPDLLLLSETAAIQALESAGLKAGNVTYAPSELPRGCVISQEQEANSFLPRGHAVSFCISLGSSPAPKAVPSLFGLTVEEAKAVLREVGLTLGEIQKIPHASPAGTVIAQSIPVGSPITSAITSVSVTVSQ